MRAPPLPSADVDAAGTIYVTWQDCRYRRDCVANGVVLSTSRDGASWSTPRRVPVGSDPSVDYFLPAVAVAPGRSAPPLSDNGIFSQPTTSQNAQRTMLTVTPGGATLTGAQAVI